MHKKERVLVAMSGGIDSTVTALMLHQQGYEVIGITMKTWDYNGVSTSKKETGCCNVDSFNDARQIAVDKGFPHYIIDIRAEFGDAVINNFVEEYIAGRTPNPCIMCNTHIKWKALLKRADALNCAYIATGHYASVYLNNNNRYVVKKGIDETKDQSYVLWGLNQHVLSRTLLPLGNYRKTEIRQMAFDFGYESLSKKAESYEICFIPDNDYRGFLKHRLPDLENQVKGGWFIDKNGKKLGQHQGYPFYTIGQRKGLDIAFGKAQYVTHINAETNTITIGDEEDLNQHSLVIHQINLIKEETIQPERICLTKIRYKDKGMQSVLYPLEDGSIKIIFENPVKGITAGQSAVFYDGDEVVGGGIIKN